MFLVFFIVGLRLLVNNSDLCLFLCSSLINVMNCVFTLSSTQQYNRCLHKQRMLIAYMCSLLTNAYKEIIYRQPGLLGTIFSIAICEITKIIIFGLQWLYYLLSTQVYFKKKQKKLLLVYDFCFKEKCPK